MRVSCLYPNSNGNGFVNNYAPLLYVGLEAIAIILLAGSQRGIIICQSLLRAQADILVLDEPTSAIDAQAEFEIFNHFRAITQHQMVLLISHRFSTVRMADKIAVIEDGVVVELGTHDELIQAGGRYAKLFLLQAAGYQ
ncbi:ABC transporter-related protein (plasmid) [Anabaena cylindrica PCC 7122]|nr:ABC transporter-related protein [Anabaena cylindrica PCC 7122]